MFADARPGLASLIPYVMQERLKMMFIVMNHAVPMSDPPDPDDLRTASHALSLCSSLEFFGIEGGAINLSFFWPDSEDKASFWPKMQSFLILSNSLTTDGHWAFPIRSHGLRDQAVDLGALS